MPNLGIAIWSLPQKGAFASFYFYLRRITYLRMSDQVFPQAHTADSLPSPTGAKAIVIVEVLAEHPEGISAAKVVRVTSFSTNLVYRLLRTLEELGWAVQREDGKGYVLTNRLLQVSGPKVGEESLTLAANPPLRRLRDKLGETVQLLTEVGGKLTVLEQFRGTQALQVSGQVGMRVPMYSCAPGKAILAAWNEERLADWFRTKGRVLKKFTPNTLATKKDLREELARIQALGFSSDRGEGIEGIHCLAVALRDRFGDPVAAITTMAPAHRFPEEEFERIAETLVETGREIEARFEG